MSEAPDVHAVIGKLSAGKPIRCKEMERLLISLGFSVRDGKKQGHRVITHSKLAGLTSAAFFLRSRKKPNSQASLCPASNSHFGSFVASGEAPRSEGVPPSMDFPVHFEGKMPSLRQNENC